MNPNLKFRLLKPSALAQMLPMTKEAITEDLEYQKALNYVSKTKKIKKYRAFIDFLFCELFKQWRAACHAYYDDGGDLLIDHPDMTDKMATDYDIYMRYVVLPLSLITYKKQMKTSWQEFQITISTFKMIMDNGPYYIKQYDVKGEDVIWTSEPIDVQRR